MLCMLFVRMYVQINLLFKMGYLEWKRRLLELVRIKIGHETLLVAPHTFFLH